MIILPITIHMKKRRKNEVLKEFGHVVRNENNNNYNSLKLEVKVFVLRYVSVSWNMETEQNFIRFIFRVFYFV